MLDEKALRRPDFRGGVPIVLADGQGWMLPRPRPLWIPDDGEDGFARAFDLGPEYDALNRAFQDAVTVGDQVRSLFAALRFLLDLNYAGLDMAGLKTLLRVDLTEPDEGSEPTDAQALARELVDLVVGNYEVPKPTAAG